MRRVESPSRGRIARRSLVLATLAVVIGGGPAAADVVLPAVLSDGMVLQQQTRAPLWGWARAGERVEVEGQWGDAPAVVETVADERGRWMVHLPTPAAGGPYRVRVTGATTRTIDDVMVGEVWICSGQSNMEMPVGDVGPGYRGVRDAEAEIAAAAHPRIRLFTVENTMSATPRADCRGRWVACSPETVRTFSATAYFFGGDLRDALDVPVGLISADWGGTVAQAWMSADALRAFPRFAGDLEHLELVGDPVRRVDVVERRVAGWWTGLDEGNEGVAGWTDVDFDDAGWSTTTLPATLAGPLATFDGLVYFRRVFELPAAAAAPGGVLELGPIDDYDDTWVNGVHVGATHAPGQWNRPRRYAVPAAALRPGRNVVCVRVLDTGGLGGINGAPDQMVLRPGAGAAVPLSGAWRVQAGRAAGDLPPQPQGASFHANLPSVLYNGMIAPIAPYALRGAIWYQGESNRSTAELYGTLFPALIADWRAAWGGAPLPFYYVQIAPFRYGADTGQTAALRDAQRAALRTPGTGMVVTMDVGDPVDIHPKNKQAVGHRLALWARAHTYGEADLVPSGPLYRSMEVEGDRVRLHFDHVGGGLEIRPAWRGVFLVAGADRRFTVAEAAAEGDTIVAWSPRVAEPVAVRYAWAPAAEASLFGGTGLPASPFRTDDWSGPLPPVENDDEMESYRTREPGFAPLFNGRDLTGWRNVNCGPGTWQVKDGRIVCTGVPTGVLRTDRMYENFVLEVEWRHLMPGGNAGVFVWSDPLPARGQPYTRGIEVQVLDGREGSWYTSDGDVFPIHGAAMRPENGRGGSRAFPTERRSNPSPLWNHFRIECVDGSIALAVNGKVVTKGHEGLPRKGYVCLESEGSPVEFRHVRLKVLPGSTPPPAPGEVADEADDGFESLYTGVDFAGWKLTPEHVGHWCAADWRIDFDGLGPDLWTEASYGDFVLMCDWRWSGPPKPADLPVIQPNGEYALGPDGKQLTRSVPEAGDSGIYLRGSSKSQVNMWCWPIGSGEVYGYRTDPAMPAEVCAGVTPTDAADAPIGDWNRFVITLRGERLTVVLNGRTVIENARLPGIAASGPIALQRHGSPIQFANLFIKRLD